MRKHAAIAMLLFCPLAGCSSRSASPESDLRLNQIQVKGTHNSYHVAPETYYNKYFDYTMPSLTEQLDTHGVRQFEIDVHYHPAEGRFAVYHTPPMFLDSGTTCYWLSDCMSEMRAWSDAHRRHHALMIFIEPKDDLVDPEHPDDTEETLLTGHFEELDAELLSIWTRERVYTPDDLQGGHASVAEALAADGWPTIASTRGKVLFAMMDSGAHRAEYTHGETSLDGRLIFAAADPSKPYAAIQRFDNPLNNEEAIAEAVQAGMLIRSRADATDEPLAGDYSRQEAALRSGAQMISTDYPAPVSDREYWLDIPGGTPSRCNPVNAPPECRSQEIEDLP